MVVMYYASDGHVLHHGVGDMDVPLKIGVAILGTVW